MPRGSLPDWAVLLATFLPVVGVLVTLVLARALRGAGRWLCLWVVPISVFALAWWLSPAVLYDGNLLAALLLTLYYVGLYAYYPVLALVGLGVAVRRRTARPREAQPAPPDPGLG